MIKFFKKFKKKKNEKYYTSSVFQTNGFPKHTFVKRENIEEDLDEIIANRNKVIMFLGYSKSGKTVYRKKYFEEHELNPIVYRCNVNSTCQDLYNHICIEADLPVKSSIMNSMSSSSSLELNNEVGYDSTKAGVKTAEQNSSSESMTRSYPKMTKVDANYICNNFKSDNKIIVLEDYHLVSNEFSQQISEDIKHFIDEEIILIVIGIPSSTNRSLKNNPDLGGRTKKIIFDYLTDEEIDELMDKGQEKLNVKIQKDVRNEIKKHSMHNAFLVQAITQKLLLNRNVNKTSSDLIRFTDKKEVSKACSLLMDELKSDYQSIIQCISQGQRKQASHKVYNQYDEIIKAIRDLNIDTLEDGITFSDIGKLSWDRFPEEVILGQIKKGTYTSEKSFKSSLNNQISAALNKLEENFERAGARKVIIYSDDRMYLMDLVLKFYLNWDTEILK